MCYGSPPLNAFACFVAAGIWTDEDLFATGGYYRQEDRPQQGIFGLRDCLAFLLDVCGLCFSSLLWKRVLSVAAAVCRRCEEKRSGRAMSACVPACRDHAVRSNQHAFPSLVKRILVVTIVITGTTVARLFSCTPPTKAFRVQSRPGLSGFSHVRVVPDDVVGRWVFSGISRYPRPFIPALLYTQLNHPHRNTCYRVSASTLPPLPRTAPNHLYLPPQCLPVNTSDVVLFVIECSVQFPFRFKWKICRCFTHSGEAALDVRAIVALNVRSLLCHVASVTETCGRAPKIEPSAHATTLAGSGAAMPSTRVCFKNIIIIVP
ncbi:hypothetical protein PR048_015895 [Dryococelus australis]|uniref:Uncharacterized protein n=1 Tax=Dryococelus australis TaxID=614101 RepID=A0ABQ9HI83_9NEOP|nr:hypothetical protein PR048_015895 [Dryococelus australis]